MRMSSGFRTLVLGLACTGCAAAARPRQLRITGTEYRFDAPAVAPAGPTEVFFHNAGRVRHEVILVRMRPGVTLKRLIASPPGVTRDTMVEGGAAILLADRGRAAPAASWSTSSPAPPTRSSARSRTGRTPSRTPRWG